MFQLTFILVIAVVESLYTKAPHKSRLKAMKQAMCQGQQLKPLMHVSL